MMRNLFRLRRRRGEDRGATLVEATFVIPLLLLLAIGSAEVGLTFVDWMSVSNATREGARVGAAAGNHSDADDMILTVVARASCNINNGDLIRVRIFKSDSNGNQHPDDQENRYRVNVLNCDPFSVSWVTEETGWLSTSRSNEMGSLHYLGVEVTFDHNTITGLFPIFNTTWTDQAVMRIEPDVEG